jgi:hypothetical protein
MRDQDQDLAEVEGRIRQKLQPYQKELELLTEIPEWSGRWQR